MIANTPGLVSNRSAVVVASQGWKAGSRIGREESNSSRKWRGEKVAIDRLGKERDVGEDRLEGGKGRKKENEASVRKRRGWLHKTDSGNADRQRQIKSVFNAACTYLFCLSLFFFFLFPLMTCRIAARVPEGPIDWFSADNEDWMDSRWDPASPRLTMEGVLGDDARNRYKVPDLWMKKGWQRDREMRRNKMMTRNEDVAGKAKRSRGWFSGRELRIRLAWEETLTQLWWPALYSGF